MSNVSNVHQFAALTKTSKALTGQRLVRLIAKKNKDGVYESENLSGSLCVSVPFVNQDAVIDSIDKLLPHIVGMVQDTQDKIIREWRLTHGRNEIPGDVFSVSACVAWLDDNATGERVSSEYLQEWFRAEYGAIAERFIRTAIDGAAPEIITAKINVLRDMFAGFASNRYSPNIPQCKAMVRFVAFAADCGEIDSRLSAYAEKAQEIQTKKEAELNTDALGF